MKKTPSLIALLFFVLTALSLTMQAAAAPATQGFVTPTPGPDGRIIIKVQEGWSCSTIQTFTGIPVSQLRALNRLDENCTLQVGQEILLGIVDAAGAPTATPDPSLATPVPLPTPTAEIGSARVCVLLFDDVNGDALHQDTEGVIENGAISVTGTSGQYSKTANTTNSVDPICFEGVLSGTYNISVAAPEGYNPTTQQNYTIEIKVGEQIYVDFGAQVRTVTQAETAQAQDTGINIYGIIGGIMVALALGLGIFAFLTTRRA